MCVLLLNLFWQHTTFITSCVANSRHGDLILCRTDLKCQTQLCPVPQRGCLKIKSIFSTNFQFHNIFIRFKIKRKMHNHRDMKTPMRLHKIFDHIVAASAKRNHNWIMMLCCHNTFQSIVHNWLLFFQFILFFITNCIQKLIDRLIWSKLGIHFLSSHLG